MLKYLKNNNKKKRKKKVSKYKYLINFKSDNLDNLG